MNGRHVEGALGAWLDGRLPGRHAERVRKHLASCPRCSGALSALIEQERQLKSALTREPGEAYLESLSRRVMERVAKGEQAAEGGGVFARPLVLRWASVAAVVVAASAVAFFALDRGVPELVNQRRATDRRASAIVRPEGTRQAPAQVAPEQTLGSHEEISALEDEEDRALPEAGAATPQATARNEGQDRVKTPGAQPGRVIEMTVPSRPGEEPRPKTPPPAVLQQRQGPPAAAAPRGDEPVYVTKPRVVEPMKVSDRLAQREEGRAQAAPWPGIAAPPAPPAPTTAAEGKATPGPTAAPGESAPSPSPEAVAKRDASLPEFRAQPAPDATADSRPLAGRLDQVAEARVCGTVADPGGRPVAGAQVIASQLGRVARTDASGRFCLTLPVGRHELSLLAVGYLTGAQSVEVGRGGASNAALTITPVAALGEGLRIGEKPEPDAPSFGLVGGRTSAAPPEPLLSQQVASAVPGNAPATVRAAQAMERLAWAAGTALSWEQAASRWERALPVLRGAPHQLTARAGLAECRYRAWKAAPTPERARIATEALASYLARAPAGAARGRGAAWLEELK